MSRRDVVRWAIAVVAMVGFFGTLALLLFRAIPDSNRDAIYILLGSMGGYVAAVVQYYFGDSDGAEHNQRSER